MPGPCHRCGRQVYSAEERLALSGSSWHQECFTCAVCNKSLDSTNLAENHENMEIYCKNCYRILYGTKGYGYGPNEPTLIANDGPLEECYDVTPSNSKCDLQQYHGRNTAIVVKPFEQMPFRKGFLYWGRHPTPKHYGHQVVPPPPRVLKRCDPDDIPIRPNSSPEAFANRNPNRLPPCPPSPVVTKTHRQNLSRQGIPHQSKLQCVPNQSNHIEHSNGPVELCARCGKPVYFAERKYGYHGVYHTRCYVCGACGKSLDTTTVSENNGVLYCTGCYKRYVATEGVGYGVGAGTLRTH